MLVCNIAIKNINMGYENKNKINTYINGNNEKPRRPVSVYDIGKLGFLLSIIVTVFWIVCPLVL